MYQHADQSWKDKPLVLSDKHQKLLATRLLEYVKEKDLKRVLVIYHGGEPLIFGVDRLIHLSKNIRKELKETDCRVDFGIQTNGVLITESILKQLGEEDISVSLSIDGPQEIHDQHRLDHKGKASFKKVHNALKLLKKFPKTFSGCIAVINPNFDPKMLFKFFDENEIKEFNILLPDANYITPPKGKDTTPELYKRWLIQAFDCWFDEYPHIRCKFFESILMAILGQGGQSDALGLGDVSLLNIETDGTYHDLDVLKITEENYSYLGMGLESHPFSSAEQVDKIKFHRYLLTKEGLSYKCQSCKHVNICGGGSVPHRYNKNGYKNPTVYCEEMYSLLDHMMERFSKLVKEESQQQGKQLIEPFNQEDMQLFWNSQTSQKWVNRLQDHLAQKNYARLRDVCRYVLSKFPEHEDKVQKIQSFSFEEAREGLLIPSVFGWLRAMYGYANGAPASNVEEEVLPEDLQYLDNLINIFQLEKDVTDFMIQAKDPWYLHSIGKSIVLDHSKEDFQQGLKNLHTALGIIKEYDSNLYKEMQVVSKYIQIIKDKRANPDKDVSFSDETLPGALFIGVWKGRGVLSPFMVAASIIHEHLHQKLYLLQQRFELFEPQATLIFSPWPQKHRPPAGALHAVYVFTHVGHFWNKVLQSGQADEIAESELDVTLRRLQQCIQDIKEKVVFTETGQLFFNCLLDEYNQLKEQSVLNYA